jgi:hypothetical protein
MEHYGLSRETVVAAPVAGLDGLRGDWERLLNVARAAESSATPYYPPAADRASPPEAVDAAYAELTRRAESLLGLMRALSTAAADGSAAPVSDDAPRPRGELRITSKV